MIQAFLFDLDDTLAATAPIWRDAEEHLLQSLDAPWSLELAARYKGMNALDLATAVHRELRPTVSRAECQRIMRSRLLANFGRGPINAIDGAIDLVHRCRDVGAAMAVASGSPLEAIELALDTLRIRDCFALVLSSEQVARGKPHPDVYLATAEQLKVQPENCLVFEDSLVGAQSAGAAGMHCAVRPSLANDAIAEVATRMVGDWNEVTVEDLVALIQD